MLYMCIEYHIQVNMYHVSAQGVDEQMINVHYYYNKINVLCLSTKQLQGQQGFHLPIVYPTFLHAS